jgi:predicted phage terminase large subunit-like protein
MKADAPDYYGHKIIGQWADHAEGALLKKYNEFALSEIRPESNVIAYIDVADEGLDYTCMVIAKIQDRKLYIVDVIYTDLNTDVAHPLCLAAANKWKPKYIMCESNNMGAIFGRGLRESYKYGDLILKNSTQNKHTRIIMSIMFINSYVHFLRQEDRSPEYQKYLDAVLSYDKDPKNNKHDDAMDATSGLSRLATSYYDGIFKNKF